LPYTPRARVVLDQAIAVAHEFATVMSAPSTCCLLVRERQGIAAQGARIAGLTEPKLRREIVRLLQGEGVAAALDIDTPDRREENADPAQHRGRSAV